jgi:type II secretion system protein G
MIANYSSAAPGLRAGGSGRYGPVALVLWPLAATFLILGDCGAVAGESRIIAAQVQIEANFATALDTYKAIVGRYPTTEEGLHILLTTVGDRTVPIMQKIPRDPWRNEYQYVCPGVHNPNSYDLCSYGPDRQPGGGDDYTNWEQGNASAEPDGQTSAGFLAIVAVCGVVVLTCAMLLVFRRQAEKRVASPKEREVGE